jgi:hypothetical protein
MNTNWPKWIKASIAKHFDSNRGGITLFVEGQKRPATESTERFELRVDGPDVNQTGPVYYTLDTVVNILITSVSNETNIYRMDALKGIILNAFTSSIPIYKYGGDSTLLGCLQLKSQIDTRDLGLRDTTLRQVSISAFYSIDLVSS